MRVFVGCEYSGIVRDEFIREGHYAISCDILPSESLYGDHIMHDVVEILENTEDGFYDLIICHPPCTYLCVAGNRYYSNTKKRQESIEWTEQLWNLCKKKGNRVCFENPVGVLSTQSNLKKPSQYIQPYMFGHPEKKKTGLWNYNLPNLIGTNNVFIEMQSLPLKEQQRIWYMSPGKDRSKRRSMFFRGIAEAMAKQWGILK